ncbi:hypothetical protein ABPG72_002136 [Tetrahymena utriculariae]
MSSSDKSLSNKPQIFINHVDLSITEADIQKACENKNTKPISVTIRKNHDQKSNNVNITFANENEAKILKGNDSVLKVNDVTLKLEEYQTIYPPNVFLKNNYGFTEEQIHEGIKAIVKHYFHLSVSNNLVNIYVQEIEDQNLLINHEHKIQGKEVRFEKFQKNVNSKQSKQNQLYIKIHTHQGTNTQDLQEFIKNKFNNEVTITAFNAMDKITQIQSTYFSINFNDDKVALDFYNELKENQKIQNYNVCVSWKRPENSEDRTLVLKFLKQNVQDEEVKQVFSQFGEVQQLETVNFTSNQNKPQTKSAYLMMANEESCKKVMSEAYKSQQVKQLFNQERPSISPYISKNEINSYKHAIKSNEASQPNYTIAQFQYPQNQAMYPYAQQIFYPPNPYQIMNQMSQPYSNQIHYNKQPNPYMNQQGRPQQKQSFPQHNKRFNHQHGNQGYQQSYPQYNQVQNGGNNYIKSQNHYGYRQQQLYTKEQLEQLLQKNHQNFDKIIHQQTRSIITQKLKQKKLDNFYDQIEKIVEMITDKENFTQAEIIEIVADEKEVADRIDEAIDLIKKAQAQAAAKN